MGANRTPSTALRTCLASGWQKLDRDAKGREIGTMRNMQGPSSDLVRVVEEECTPGRTLAKALAVAEDPAAFTTTTGATVTTP